MNLCANAAHAMHEKGGVLQIEGVNLYLEGGNEVSLELKAGWYLRMTVSDNGPGINADIIDRIFEPFFTTKKTGEGTGLGLAVVHGIVKNLGGVVIVRSCIGQGTAFEIYLPLIDDKDETIDHDLEIAYVGGKERILFVDDEDAITMVAEEMLNKLGYDIFVTTSSLEALKFFRLQPGRFDIVITDQAMPDMTGMAMAEELLKVRPDLPIILCTGLSEIVIPAQAESIGISGFIMKPFTIANLDATIRKVLMKKI
jgi:CheY-like chemotaxis protein